jgi:hypothetical protein
MTGTDSCQTEARLFAERDPGLHGSRLTVVIDPRVFWDGDQPNWTVEKLSQAFAWTDIATLEPEDHWNNGLVVVHPGFTMIDLASPMTNFWGVWDRFTLSLISKLDKPVLVRVHYFSDVGYKRHAQFGAPGAPTTVDVTFYTKEYFDWFETTPGAWEKIVRESMRGLVRTHRWYDQFGLTTKPILDRFADGDTEIENVDYEYADEDTSEVVILGVPEPITALAFTVPHAVYSDTHMP